MIETSRVRELFSYSEETGLFVRRVSVARRKEARVGHVLSGVQSNGYMRVMVDGESVLVHRLVFIYMGVSLTGQVDHINHIRTDNRWENLRQVSHAENGRNAKKPITNKSGTVGVCWDTNNRKWYVQIKYNGQNHFLGRFSSIEDAKEARAQKEVKFGFHENHGK